MNTAMVSMAVTPTILSTFLSHYFNRKPLKQRPTAHLSYDEGLHLIRSFLAFASHHALEDLQAFTAQWVPHPQWIKVDEVEIPEDKLIESANALVEQLGPDGIRKVGGRNWWQWRQPNRPLKGEWIEMKSDYNERKKLNDLGKRIILYIHGGAYYFGSIDEHRYQMQRHARKLKARVFAPEYRLAPQFPFPCGLQDCIAAYLYLLTTHDPTTIIFAGDSAGGGMVLSMLVTLRDQGFPLPAGGILISPWVDLTHSFPSLSEDCPLDYIPPCGFHHKPSEAWPPLNMDELAELKEKMAKNIKPGQTKLMKPESSEMNRISQNPPEPSAERLLEDGPLVGSLAETTYVTINLDGKEVQLKEQIQMYTTNELLSHPLVSPVLQPTLGGLPPLLITTGGGEILRDEQIYIAHKCANPTAYPPGDAYMDERAREQIARFKPTDVQLQIWDDLCHVAPTLSFTRPAKFMYRSIAQFGAWALARAQKTEIEILDDSSISVVSNSGSDTEEPNIRGKDEDDDLPESDQPQVGKAGDPLPPFKDHMIRQRVSRHGVIRALEPESDLPACQIPPNEIGVVKEGPVRKWLEIRRQWDNRYGSVRAKVHKRRLKEMIAGYEVFEGETPPPSSLAARRKVGDGAVGRKRKKSAGLALWSLWGAKHDEATYHREQRADRAPIVKVATNEEGEGAREAADLQRQERAVLKKNAAVGRSRSRKRVVKDEHQIANEDDVDENTPVAVLVAKRKEKEKAQEEPLPSPTSSLLAPETGATGKRAFLGGIAMPFSLKKEAETASMLTLNSVADQPSRTVSPRPPSQEIGLAVATSAAPAPAAPAVPAAANEKANNREDHDDEENDNDNDNDSGTETPTLSSSVYATPLPLGAGEDKGYIDGGSGPIVAADGATIAGGGRPPLESFITAEEELPRAQQ
ncbi:hypothetical protein F5X99DRAFT_309397 [Biscogniauxia marginata]|nr:hypothetical protein F5X99DRAFT_309397 [Biscogniauxia marginata]